MLLLHGMGAVPATPGRNEAEDQRRREAGLVGPATHTPAPGDVLDDAGSWISEHKLLAGGVAAALAVGGFLWWRGR